MKTCMVMAIVAGMAAPALLAQEKITPLDVKTGLWQSTGTLSLKGSLGIPPEMAAKLTPEQQARMQAAMKASGSAPPRTISSKGCLKQEDLTRDPFAPAKGDTGMTCHENLIRSTSSDADVQIACSDSSGSSGTYHMTFHAVDREHVTGTGNGSVTMMGHTLQSEWSMHSQWIQANCPARPEE